MFATQTSWRYLYMVRGERCLVIWLAIRLDRYHEVNQECHEDSQRL